MQERHLDKKRYFEEQAYTTLRHVIPYISAHFPLIPGKRILEIGCGEGGNLKPFLEAGCSVTGVDLSSYKIEIGKLFYAAHPMAGNLQLICDDIYKLTAPDKPFDLILMRDVIEHIHHQEKFMHFIKSFLAPRGLFFLAFPPWQNPFGGHQQICRNKILSKLPWIHLLPARTYAFILRAGGEPETRVEALLEIKQTGLTLERFMKMLSHEKYNIISMDLFLINPNYEVKFGLKPRKTPQLIAKIPLLRNVFTTSAYFLLRQD